MNKAEPLVHVVDDDPSFLKAVSRLLRASGRQVRSHCAPADFLAQLSPDSRGCVIADLQMPGMDGLQLQRAMAQAHCGMPIIFLTGHGDIPTSVHAMRAGAEDFLQKLAPREQLLAAVTRALERDQRERQAQARQREKRALLESLTPREREVLEQVVRGRLNKQIAQDLCIDERTVKFHRTNITTKLKVDSIAQLVTLAQEMGVHPSSPLPASDPANLP